MKTSERRTAVRVHEPRGITLRAQALLGVLQTVIETLEELHGCLLGFEVSKIL